MLKKSITLFASALLFVVIGASSSKAQEINLGGFKGNVDTIVTHGFSVRAENNNCFLVSGSPTTTSSALSALTGYTPHDGNGGCNYKRKDTYGNTASKVVDVGSVLADDGRLNFDRGDVIDAGQSISLSFNGSHASGARLNLSGIAMVNPVLDINSVHFKTLSTDSEEHLESDIKIGNAYISAALSPNVDITFGNYVQSQGGTALFPIGVNVVNPVSLPILRSPGAQLKDALLPQAMVGLTGYLDGGVTAEVYYQLEQKELELDASGTFFGSDLVGVGNQQGIISSALYNEDTSLPSGMGYHDVANCIKGKHPSNFGGAHLLTKCTDAALWSPYEDAYSVVYDLFDEHFGAGHATQELSGAAALGGTTYDAIFQAAAAGGSVDTFFDAVGGHASGANSSLTDAQLRTAFQTLVGQYPGRGDRAGTLYIRRAPDAEAKDSGQYGLNLSGYLDDVGTGVEWGLYFNNSHSNTPRIRMLAITNGYATDVFAYLNTANTSLGQKDFTDGNVTNFERALAGIQYSPTICGLLPGVVAGAFMNGAYLHDGAECWAAMHSNGVNSTFESASIAALATIAFANGARYQVYYPEDIKTMGLSLSTGLNGWATNVEVAYRPDHPLQIGVGDLVNNLIDSTYGTLVQSITGTSGATEAELAALAAQKWSGTPNCDISSATGTAATVANYNQCDGTAEFDVWTANVNLAKSFTASEPFVVNAGADSASLLIDIGAVSVPDLSYAQGVVSSGQFQQGHDVYQNGCLNSTGVSNKFSGQANGLFGAGYCEANSGADDFAISYKLRAAMTYNNFNNSKWSFTPSFGWNHDLSGDAPSSVGGFVEGRMSASATASFASGGVTSSISYQMELGDELNNSSVDKDYVSANFSYAF
jgi:hypothetical protein